MTDFKTRAKCVFLKVFGVILSCCGNIISTTGENFYRIDRYKTTAKGRIFNDKKTVEEIIYVAVCQNCGHLIVRYRQRVKNKAGKKKLGNTLDFTGKKADEFFYKNYDKFVEYPLESPFLTEKQGRTIPFIYGKTIDGLTQQPYYLDESDKAGNIIDVPVKKIPSIL